MTPIPMDDTLPADPDAIVERLFDPERPTDELVPLYHQLRNLAPVHQSGIERLGRPWIVTRHADAAWVAREKCLIKDERLVDQLGGDPNGFFARMMKRMMERMFAQRLGGISSTALEMTIILTEKRPISTAYLSLSHPELEPASLNETSRYETRFTCGVSESLTEHQALNSALSWALKSS